MGRVLEWGDSEYEFAMPGKCVEELQKLTGHGLLKLATRISDGDWFLEEIRHIIRLGLIGGGMGAVEANRLVNMYIGQGEITVPLAGMAANSAVLLAGVILNDVLFGFTNIPQKKTETKKKTPKAS